MINVRDKKYDSNIKPKVNHRRGTRHVSNSALRDKVSVRSLAKENHMVVADISPILRSENLKQNDP